MPEVDLSEFEKLSTPPRKAPCQIAAALEAVDGEADHLRAALASAVISPGAIVKWLERRSVSTNTSAVLSHRRGTCTCVTDA